MRPVFILLLCGCLHPATVHASADVFVCSSKEITLRNGKIFKTKQKPFALKYYRNTKKLYRQRNDRWEAWSCVWDGRLTLSCVPNNAGAVGEIMEFRFSGKYGGSNLLRAKLDTRTKTIVADVADCDSLLKIEPE